MLFRSENKIEASVYRGTKLISHVSMNNQLQTSNISELELYFPFRNNINHKVIRNIDGTHGINQITSRTLANVNITDCKRGPSSLTIHEDRDAPFHLLPVLETIESFLWKTDFTLVPGIILHDYLKN